MRTDFKILEVKVPIIFFRHVGFSATQGYTLHLKSGYASKMTIFINKWQIEFLNEGLYICNTKPTNLIHTIPNP